MAPKILDLNEVVTENLKMLTRVIGEDIDLVMVPAATLGAVRADAGQIDQVIMNLALNARDAMPSGGKLTIETSNVSLDEEYARFHAPLRPGDYVMLTISDTGMGMDSETQSHIFEPFFTTKGTEGNRAGALHSLRNHQAEWRLHMGLQRVRQGHHVQDLFATRRGESGNSRASRLLRAEACFHRAWNGDHPSGRGRSQSALPRSPVPGESRATE